MRNKKNDANRFYLCISDLVVDGVLMCTAGKRYRIQDAESGPGEAPAEVAGYGAVAADDTAESRRGVLCGGMISSDFLSDGAGILRKRLQSEIYWKD